VQVRRPLPGRRPVVPGGVPLVEQGPQLCLAGVPERAPSPPTGGHGQSAVPPPLQRIRGGRTGQGIVLARRKPTTTKLLGSLQPGEK
jgi:hypothetical protein